MLTIASGLRSPNGVAFRDGALYVAEISRVLRFDNIEAQLRSPPAPVVVNASFPDKSHHGWKFIRFGPDGKLYVPVGAPCNVCEEQDPRFAGNLAEATELGKSPDRLPFPTLRDGGVDNFWQDGDHTRGVPALNTSPWVL